MAIRDWSPRRLALAWVVGLALEGALVAAQLAQTRAFERRMEREQAAMRPHQAAHPVPPAMRDSLLRVLREQHGITISMRGDSATGIALSPDAQRKAAAAASGLGDALRVVSVVAALFVAVVYLPIPVALVWTTAVWARARRRVPAAGISAPVV